MALRPIPIHHKALVDAYVELDVFSQCKNPLRRLAGGLSARNMGKNDLWIAATTVVVGGKLVTFDHDFAHLYQDWFEVVTPF